MQVHSTLLFNISASLILPGKLGMFGILGLGYIVMISYRNRVNGYEETSGKGKI
ncbi:hypothetical protein [Oceanobacillus senegalensis]|uniref:hypothetical protein n=1 Tax=Oceanobacillus senegalensis TaxID=1936063 RepID=UPI001C4FD7F1|nr:hypothetical protein [Oceanobacillus senegalensis]